MIKKSEYYFLVTALLMLALFYMGTESDREELRLVYINPKSPDDIVLIDSQAVVPILYDSLVINHFAPIEEKKQQFISQVLPAILVAKFRLQNQSKRMEHIVSKLRKNEKLNEKEEKFATGLKNKFRAENYENLLVRLKVHPNSLVLAQAAIESGWGSSRFAIQGNNLFGVWTNANDKKAIRSLFNREDQGIYLKKYESIDESIEHYFLTLGRHRAYQKFRNKRNINDDVYQLIESLDKYSEKGEEYTRLIAKIIEWNNLEEYDNHYIDPRYFETKSKWQVFLDDPLFTSQNISLLFQ